MNDPYRGGGVPREEILSLAVCVPGMGDAHMQTTLDAATTVWNQRLARGGRIKHLAQAGTNPIVITVVIEYPS